MDNSSDHNRVHVGLPKPSAESNLLVAMTAAAALGIPIPEFSFKLPRTRTMVPKLENGRNYCYGPMDLKSATSECENRMAVYQNTHYIHITHLMKKI